MSDGMNSGGLAPDLVGYSIYFLAIQLFSPAFQSNIRNNIGLDWMLVYLHMCIVVCILHLYIFLKIKGFKLK